MPEIPLDASDLLRHAADAIIAVDQDRRVLSMNPSAEALTGYSEREATGQPCARILGSSVCGEQCPFHEAFYQDRQVTSFDVRVSNRRGEQVPVCINTSVLRDASGRKIGVVESIRDIRHILKLIEQRERAVEETRKLAAQLEAILESTGDAILAVDLDGLIVSFNSAAEELLGYRRDEVLGRPVEEICRGEFCPLRETLERGEGLPASELNLRVRDGSLVPVWFRTALLRDGGRKITGAVAIFRDLREVRQLRADWREAHGLDRLIGKSAAMRAVRERIQQVAPTDTTVLILGESGTGKELVAEILHSLSPRWDKPLVKVNCAALPETLLESELFGHVRGAFTGAVSDRKGRFELAHGGTIFLDEIGDLPLPLQVKLLRVLQEREFERVGSTRTIRVDLRVIAATHRDLETMVAQGQFRQDLYYRLNVVPIRIPPLREHREDIPLLAEKILDELAARTGNRRKHLTPQALRRLMDYDWPGNVRELENALEYAVVTSSDDWIQPEDLPALRSPTGRAGREAALSAARSQAEREALVAALESSATLSEAAQRLGVSRATLWRKMKRLGVSTVKQVSYR